MTLWERSALTAEDMESWAKNRQRREDRLGRGKEMSRREERRKKQEEVRENCTVSEKCHWSPREREG